MTPAGPASGGGDGGRPLLLPEFAPQSGVIITWPHCATDWRPVLDDIEQLYARLAAAITRHERLLVICRDAAHRRHVNLQFARAGVVPPAVAFALAVTDDTWVRDYGPLACRGGGRLVLHDFSFDGWAGKYPAAQDDRVTRGLYDSGFLGAGELRRHRLVLEGGSIDTDGRGTLLTTVRCLLESGRNPGVDRSRLEVLLREQLGIDRVLWLAHGELAGDDTDAHVDMLARFCDPDTIAYSSCSDPADEHHAPLAAMREQLQGLRTREGRPYRLVPLPLPRAIHAADGRRLPASYANFLVLNGAVLMPAYADPADRLALAALGGCFPGRRVEAIDCRALIRQNGSLHCATMQLPEGVLKADGETG